MMVVVVVANVARTATGMGGLEGFAARVVAYTDCKNGFVASCYPMFSCPKIANKEREYDQQGVKCQQ